MASKMKTTKARKNEHRKAMGARSWAQAQQDHKANAAANAERHEANLYAVAEMSALGRPGTFALPRLMGTQPGRKSNHGNGSPVRASKVARYLTRRLNGVTQKKA
jgi:hypothetical protein